jgi:hypothetical protein
VGDKVYFAAGEGGNDIDASGAVGYNMFVMTGRIAASGDVTSLLKAEAPSDTIGQSRFAKLFKDCASLTAAPRLPATTLGAYCYNDMFRGCTSLVVAPELPATSLASGCYSGMFYGCTQLTEVTTKQSHWGDALSTSAWLYNVAASGEFYCPAELGTNETIGRGTSKCPEGWTVVNI